MKKRNFILMLIVTLTLIVVPVFAQTPTPTQDQNIDYRLPYAGILPDSFLYNLKTFRDRLISSFISDPVKKADFDLLQADKRLSAAITLFDKGQSKYDLAETTISKGENYFDDSIKNVKLAKLQGIVIDPSLFLNMDLSSKKHKQILQTMVFKTTGDLQKRFSKDLERMDEFSNEVMIIKSK